MEPEIVEQAQYANLLALFVLAVIVGYGAYRLGDRAGRAVVRWFDRRKSAPMPFVSHAVALDVPKGFTTTTTAFDPVPEKYDAVSAAWGFLGSPTIASKTATESALALEQERRRQEAAEARVECPHRFVEQFHNVATAETVRTCTGCGREKRIPDSMFVVASDSQTLWNSIPWTKKKVKK